MNNSNPFYDENAKLLFSNSSGLKSIFFVKLCLLDGVVWTVGLTEEIKLRFLISGVWWLHPKSFNIIFFYTNIHGLINFLGQFRT